MMKEQNELRITVAQALQHPKALANQNPGASIRAADIDGLLATAKKLFPESPILKLLTPLGETTTAGDATLRLSVLNGAIIGATVPE